MKRAAVWSAVGLLAVVAMATVSWTSPNSLRITDGAGRHHVAPGVFMLDEMRQRVTAVDVSQDPAGWASSLAYLFDYIRETLARGGLMAPAVPDDTTTVGCARELIGHLQSEYAAFVKTYGQTARARPPAPQWGSERDRQLWEEQTSAQLAREPRWGPYLLPTWRNNLAAIAALDGSIE